MVAYFLGEAQAGVYGASNRVDRGRPADDVRHVTVAGSSSERRLQRGRHEEAKRVLQTVSAWNVTLLWPVFLTLAFGAETVLRLFGEEFTSGVRLVQIFSVAILVIVGLGVGDTLLLMTGQSMASLINHVVALAIMVTMSAALLPRVGVIGAAWAWAASRVIVRLLAVIRVWQTNQVHGLGQPVITAALIALAAFVPTGLFAHTTDRQRHRRRRRPHRRRADRAGRGLSPVPKCAATRPARRRRPP